MKILLIIIFYGLFYHFFENLFNFISMDLFNKKKTWQEKLKLRVSIASSFWMIPNGSICGLLLYFLFLIPFNMNNIFVLLSVCLIGGIIITSVELLSGLFLNVKLKLNLWDYSKSKINYKGQIDLYHSLAWCGLTYLFYIVNFLFKGN